MTERPGQNRTRAHDSRRGERGFGIVQVVITLAIVGIISTFAIIKITAARNSLRLSGAARVFASWVEKARLDAIRRHSTSSVQFLNTTTYRVTMDFDGRGEVRSRDMTFESGISLPPLSQIPAALNFDWRGRTSNCTITFAIENTNGDQTSVDVGGSGDVTVDSEVDDVPNINYTNVNKTSDILTDSTVTGTTTVTTVTSDCTSTVGGTGTVTSTGSTSAGTPCTASAAPSSITIKKAGGSTVTVTVTQSNSVSGTVTVTAPSNLKVTPVSSTSITANGSTSFKVESTNSTRGGFQVIFTTPCSQVTISVKVIK